ncbi:MAG: (2Fe-2S)-binding protein, partial [Dehalococcoidia bacterium]|nr:(2Fe-2S)-binding protein [Dehalococcoidia bacterium]
MPFSGIQAKTVSLTIDGKEIAAPEGKNLLWVALDHGTYIPNLCAIRENREPFASCRLCFVEIEGRAKPVTACTVLVAEGMAVNTKGAKALSLARASFELLLSSLPVDCAHCPKSGRCEVQKIAKYLGVKLNTKR